MPQVQVERREMHHPALAGAEAIALAHKGKKTVQLSPQEQKELLDRLVAQNKLLNDVEDASGV